MINERRYALTARLGSDRGSDQTLHIERYAVRGAFSSHVCNAEVLHKSAP